MMATHTPRHQIGFQAFICKFFSFTIDNIQNLFQLFLGKTFSRGRLQPESAAFCGCFQCVPCYSVEPSKNIPSKNAGQCGLSKKSPITVVSVPYALLKASITC